MSGGHRPVGGGAARSPSHGALGEPSPWVLRFAGLVPGEGRVLDYACGSGRHALWLASEGFLVEAVDRDGPALKRLEGKHNIRTLEADLEAGPWPFEGRRFDAVVMTNYLYRPRLSAMLELVAPGGVLIAETFMIGNERFGRPRNPDYLLAPQELLERTAGDFTVVAFEQGEIEEPKPAVVQRICAIRGATTARLPGRPGK